MHTALKPARKKRSSPTPGERGEFETVADLRWRGGGPDVPGLLRRMLDLRAAVRATCSGRRPRTAGRDSW